MKTTMDEPDENDPNLEFLQALGHKLADDKPEGYGTLGVTYEWIALRPTGQREQIRARCITDDELMTFTIKVDPRYGVTINRHTKGPNAVQYNGKAVGCWECPTCKQWVVK